MDTFKVIFMGTPEFAVASLEMLLSNGVNVVAVVTAPDKPQGRGQKVTFSPVKQCALRHQLPVLQPTNLKSESFLRELDRFQADLQVVVAFRMLPEAVWSRPKLGTFNLHASLLPQYRGAAPINWALINGENETGVTTFFLQHEIDTGHIIYQEKEPINYSDDAGTLHDRLMKRGAALVLKTVQAIHKGNPPTLPQSETGELKRAPKIFKETCEINWDQSAEQVRNFVRGLSPYPGAWTSLHGKVYKIFRTEVVALEQDTTEDLLPGQYRTDNKTHLWFKTRDGLINVTELQAEGKKRMNTEEFFRGNKL
ncbi:MAG TPA: methionyl-tRNA formyltransferase [Ohtaekwangia sp.]|nr:methionyl-tRNA formyltransferase [Ohtaekwangia sp.]